MKSLPCEPGCHGANFGFKKGGGYYAYVASKFANVFDVVDMDTLELVGRIPSTIQRMARSRPTTAWAGKASCPYRSADAGMLAPTLKLAGTGKLSPKVEAWIKLVTKEQRGD